MKKTTTFLALILLFTLMSQTAISQNQINSTFKASNTSEWQHLNPQPSAYDAVNVYFLNNQLGYILNTNQVLRTEDGGDTWKVLQEITPSAKQMAFKDNCGYIISNKYNKGLLYKSTNMGYEWNEVNANFTEELVAISLISKDTLIITGNRTLYTSFDGGQSWTSSKFPIYYENILSSYFVSATEGHIGYYNGNVYKTVDGGKTWVQKSSNSTSSSSINKIYFVNDSVGFIPQGYMDNILITDDRGETWTYLKRTNRVYEPHFLDSENGYKIVNGVIYQTKNGGTSWERVGFLNGEIAGENISDIYFFDNQTGFAVGLGGRILKTTDNGKTWSYYSVTYNDIRKLDFISATTIYCLQGNSFIKTTDGGTNWTAIPAPRANSSTNDFDFVDENVGYAIADNNKVYKTTDGGKTWSITNNGNYLFHERLYSIVFTDQNTGFASGGSNPGSTFKTTDGGASWQKVNEYDFVQMKFLTSKIGYGNTKNKIFKTSDGGSSWAPLSVPEVGSSIASFDFLDENIGYLVGGSACEVFKTIDGGLTWGKLPNAPYLFYKSVSFYSERIGYITDDYGVTYQTSNGGKSWNILAKPFNTLGLELYQDKVFAFGNNGKIIKQDVTYPEIVLHLEPASSITTSSAIIAGNATSNGGKITNLRIEYGLETLTNISVELPNEVEPNGTLDISTKLNNLIPNKTYSYRMTAKCNDMNYESELLNFRTPPAYSYRNTKFYIGVNSVDINAQVISFDQEISDIVFEYSEDLSYNLKKTPTPNIIPAGESNLITVILDSLKPSTRYNLRVKATYKGSTVYLNQSSFNTLAEYELKAGVVKYGEDMFTAQVTIRAFASTISNVELQYDTSREYKNSVSHDRVYNQGESGYFNTDIKGIDTTAIYFIRAKANIGDRIIYSNEQVFTLQPKVVLIPIEHLQLSESSVILRGLAYNNINTGYLTNFRFHYGLTEELTDSVTANPKVLGYTSYAQVAASLNNLTPNTTYYARIKAFNPVSLVTFESDLFTFKISTTGIYEIQDNLNIVAYPNPATDYVFIKSDKTVDKIELFDATGNLVATSSTTNSLDLSGYSKGIYFLRVFTENNRATIKIIKQ